MTLHPPPPFGHLLRRHRVAAGLSQEALAERAGLSVDAIGLLERGERRHPQRHTRQVLAEALALRGEEREFFLTATRPHTEGSGQPFADLPNQDIPLLGREADVERAQALLRGTARLLTLTGPGGVGKSRLAAAVAEQIAGSFADGVRFVPLASLADPALVVRAIAAAVGVQETGARSLRSSLEAALVL